MQAQTNTDTHDGGHVAAPLRLLRYPEVIRRVGLCRSEITTRVREGDFPQPVPLGPRAVGFPEHEIDGYVRELMAKRGAA